MDGLEELGGIDALDSNLDLSFECGHSLDGLLEGIEGIVQLVEDGFNLERLFVDQQLQRP